jgi:hypothetical protein
MDINFIYSPLVTERSIRLLRILPGLDEEVIRCELQAATLSPPSVEQQPPFEALSYVWGPPDPPQNIICNGVVKTVTPNLASALRRIRASEEFVRRAFWIDALCINQDDLDERNQQVLLMRELYARADNVIVHLGEDGDSHADTVLDVITKANLYVRSEAGLEAEDVIERDHLRGLPMSQSPNGFVDSNDERTPAIR